MSNIKGLLVGMHFRPPAKQLLASLPTGTLLTLEPEPENPYDEKAIKVLLDASQIPESQHETLRLTLDGTGHDLESVLEQGKWQLGYVAASDGKPLRGTDLQGTLEFAEPVSRGQRTVELSFDAQGRPIISLRGEIDLDFSQTTE